MMVFNPPWAKVEQVYLGLIKKNCVVAILKHTKNGFVYCWHHRCNIPKVVVVINPADEYITLSQDQAAQITWTV